MAQPSASLFAAVAAGAGCRFAIAVGLLLVSGLRRACADLGWRVLDEDKKSVGTGPQRRGRRQTDKALNGGAADAFLTWTVPRTPWDADNRLISPQVQPIEEVPTIVAGWVWLRRVKGWSGVLVHLSSRSRQQ
ncbi:hypothetical protein B0T26DRAFT_540700 [Lasiosphaeria miniovina]|uniref:Uncharacterized protein n=1 Tax=Lasiosphaeria miniovina TaxID=1954250 RepID=A0AA39ZRB0_9PEZI|nr:uncharacterized protein B0T26DRAFT_540700 [Lasiosphaeria miniovina]KAK0702084.1 hypothetical protein B0T26DRAFT_540700 [Lasiosphaeria miniovina]